MYKVSKTAPAIIKRETIINNAFVINLQHFFGPLFQHIFIHGAGSSQQHLSIKIAAHQKTPQATITTKTIRNGKIIVAGL